MGTLDDLLRLDGVVAAGEFSRDGKLLDWQLRLDLSPEMNTTILEVGRMTGQFLASVTMTFESLATAYDKLSDMTWIPQKGWMYTGGTWTVLVGGNRGVYVETAKADFPRLFEALGLGPTTTS